VDLRKARLGMIRAFPGGWDSMAAALGMTRQALENRVYERKGQSLLTETDLQMQALSDTNFFAIAVARLSGGTYVKLPRLDNVGRAELLEKFNELYAELGSLSQTFKGAIDDDEIDRGERVSIETTADKMHRTLEELLAVMFRVYCRHGSDTLDSTRED
jgi:hypothetical protein